jgi:hypothetical protein
MSTVKKCLVLQDAVLVSVNQYINFSALKKAMLNPRP